MPAPISEAFASTLRSDPTAALAALMVIAGAHRELYVWANHAICGATLQSEPPKLHEGGNGAKRPVAVRRRRDGGDHRLAKRDKADERLVEAMKSASDASIRAWAKAIGRSRTSTVNSLYRLRDVGRAETSDGRWRLIEESAPKETSRWAKPLSASARPSVHHPSRRDVRPNFCPILDFAVLRQQRDPAAGFNSKEI
jgi:hypothetical protein